MIYSTNKTSERDDRRSLKTYLHRHGHQLAGLIILAAVIFLGFIGYRETHPKAPDYREMLGIDGMKLSYKVSVEGFDGEMFIYSVYFKKELTQEKKDEFYSRIDALIAESFENTYCGDIMVTEDGDKKMSIILDLGNAEDGRMIKGILEALNGMDGIKKVVINEGSEDN